MAVSAIIPAYNEALTVGRVIETLQQVSLINEIIVVNDGSSDDTGAVARRSGAVVIDLQENRGKGAAMAAGARSAGGEFLLFLDADLEGLTPDHVRDLLYPVLSGEADMSLGIFQSGRLPTDYAQVVAPYISGQRVISRELFLQAGVDNSRFEVEMILSRFAARRGLRVKKVPLHNLTHLMKEEKRGVARGLVERLGMYRDITKYYWKAGRSGKPVLRPLFVYLTVLSLLLVTGYNLTNISIARAEAGRLLHLSLEQGRRILVISPHPDDEALAAGGMMAQAEASGCQVRVVYLTSGDGFQRGLEFYKRKIRLTPEDYLCYGQERMNEARNAMQQLGLSSDDLIFLGYPDGGLKEIWDSCWDPGQPYRSTRTEVSQVPYDDAYVPGAPYTAPALIGCLVRVLDEYQPTDVFIPDPGDGHSDHRAAGEISLAAVSCWAGYGNRHLSVYTYLIHAGFWQIVPRVDRNDILLPPRAFLNRGTGWYTLPLSRESLELKKGALACYQSQMRVISSFMNNFLRPNEIFSQVPEPALAAVKSRLLKHQDLLQRSVWKNRGTAGA